MYSCTVAATQQFTEKHNFVAFDLVSQNCMQTDECAHVGCIWIMGKAFTDRCSRTDVATPACVSHSALPGCSWSSAKMGGITSRCVCTIIGLSSTVSPFSQMKMR